MLHPGQSKVCRRVQRIGDIVDHEKAVVGDQNRIPQEVKAEFFTECVLLTIGKGRRRAVLVSDQQKGIAADS